jgi:hypothetical protein
MLLNENPSFQPEVNNWIGELHRHAFRLASTDTGLEESAFPAFRPLTLEQALDQKFLPE